MYKMYAQKFILKEKRTTKDKNYQSGHSTNANSSLQAAKIGNQFAITRGDDLESRSNRIVPIVKSNLAVAYKTSEYIASQNIRFRTPISIKKHVPNNQAFQSQGSFDYQIPNDTYTNPNPEFELTYQAYLDDNQPLPDALHLDPEQGHFHGQVGTDDRYWLLFNQPGLYFSISDNQTTSRQQYGNWGIKLIAYDQCQEPVDQIFYINFTNQALYSLKKNPIPDQKVDFRKVTVNQIIKKDFVDPNNDTLWYSLKMENGEPLPDWVKFDKDLLKIEYHPEKEKSIGNYKLRFRISDGLLDYHTQFGVKAQKKGGQ
ncbi:dystroglycan-related [Anaeramoeba flamelloides]|uniref:Dystroglycan-related n=1 Tax=Anaeramoeba flamelloides TaxID=1746091 RepID=A0AAV7Z6S8_9EUKA|nr:dystroglycan-related [Anaeramoeba flamelloides]